MIIIIIFFKYNAVVLVSSQCLKHITHHSLIIYISSRTHTVLHTSVAAFVFAMPHSERTPSSDDSHAMSLAPTLTVEKHNSSNFLDISSCVPTVSGSQSSV